MLTRHVSLPCTGQINTARQQPALASALAPGAGEGRTTLGIPFHLSHGRHGEDSASQVQRKQSSSSQTSSLRSFCSAENIHPYQSALQKPVLPCAPGAGVGRGTVLWMVES